MLPKFLKAHGIQQSSSLRDVEKGLEVLWKNLERKKHLISVSPRVIAQRIVLNFHTETVINKLKTLQDILTHQVRNLLQQDSDATLITSRSRLLRNQIRDIDRLQRPNYNELTKLFDSLPNSVHQEVPDEPLIIGRQGIKKYFKFAPKDHVKLGAKLGLFDLTAGSSVSGHRFVYLTGWGARLAHALEQWVIDFLLSQNFELFSPPDIVKNRVLDGCGYRPEGNATQVYRVLHRSETQLSLAGTGEIPLVGYYADKRIDFESSPAPEILMCAASNCYRAEAGDRGKEIRGLYRLHQFRKIEMVSLTPPSMTTSNRVFAKLLNIQKEIYNKLGLHYQQVLIPADDLGAVAHRKVDIEAWMPGMNKYGEVTSASECLSYQSTRLNIKCNEGYVYTLNATAIAIPRTMIAILETYQMENGNIQVPNVLVPYLKRLYILKKSSFHPSESRKGIDNHNFLDPFL